MVVVNWHTLTIDEHSANEKPGLKLRARAEMCEFNFENAPSPVGADVTQCGKVTSYDLFFPVTSSGRVTPFVLRIRKFQAA